MAAPSQRRNLWLTFGAAAATLVVVVGVLAGPTIMSCLGSSADLLACVRQDVVEAGLLPSDDLQSPSEVPPAVPEAPPAVVPDQPPREPELNLIRAEPDGQMIVAGTGKPGISVQVFADDIVIGETETEPNGDWVVIPDKPIITGGAEITVGIAGGNARSGRSFVVIINPDRVSEPLVVASTPGTASKVLQGLPEAPTQAIEPAPAPVQVAEPTPQPEPAPAIEPMPVPVQVAEPAPTADPTPMQIAEPASVAQPQPAPVTEPIAKPEPQPVTKPSPAPVAEPEPVPLANPEPLADPVDKPLTGRASEPTPEPEVTIERRPNTLTAPAPEAPIQVAEAEPAPAVPVAPDLTPTPKAPPTIDAIEIDGYANFFAGAGPEGATIRLYIDDRFVADARVEGGRWLVEAQGALTLRRQRVRIDLLQAETARVAARAEVNFVIDLPDDVTLLPEADGSVTPGATVGNEVALDPAPVPVADPLAEDEVAEIAPTEPEIPTMTASPTADPERLRFASGKAIIRRGENLWTIARRVYGDGMKYTTIFDANKDQMRSPAHIYPGQVFDLPKVQEDGGVN